MINRLIIILTTSIACSTLWASSTLASNLFSDQKIPYSQGKYRLNFDHTDVNLSSISSVKNWLNNDLRKWLKLGKNDSLELTLPAQITGDFKFYRIQQTHNNLPVIGLETVLTTWRNQPTAILGENQPLDNLAVKPAINLKKAIQNSQLETNKKHQTRIVYFHRTHTDTRLSYEITGSFKQGTTARFETVYIDAKTGKIISRMAQEHSAMKRYILDLKSACKAAGINRPVKFKKMYKLYYYIMKNNKFIVRTENSAPVNIKGIDKFHKLLGNAYVFLKSTYKMDSLDNNGIRLVGFSRVRYNRKGKGPQCVGNTFNATWIGSLNALFVPENAIDFVEVVAHELAHGIISNGSKLKYKGQSGALNESIADAIGVSFRAWLNAGGNINNPVRNFHSSPSVWKLRAPGRRILRNLANPKSASPRHPDHFADFVVTSRDHGGVHTNSNIINQAFYILSVGGNHPRLRTGPVVKGIGIRKASQIYALAGSSILTPTSNFEDARFAFALAARTLFGKHSQEWVSVHKSMDAVGIDGNWNMPARTQPRTDRQPPVTPRTEPRKPASVPATPKQPRSTPVPETPRTTPAPQTPRTTPAPQTQPKPKKVVVKKKPPAPVKNTTPKWVWLSLIGTGLFIAIIILIKMRPRYDDNPQFQANQTDDSNKETSGYSAIAHPENCLGTLIAMDHSESIPLDRSLLNSAEGIIIGRAPELVHVVMESNDVSRRHIRLRSYGGQIYIEDMNSSYGSQVDGYALQAFTPVKLNDRQIIRIAGHSYQFILSV